MTVLDPINAQNNVTRSTRKYNVIKVFYYYYYFYHLIRPFSDHQIDDLQLRLPLNQPALLLRHRRRESTGPTLLELGSLSEETPGLEIPFGLE